MKNFPSKEAWNNHYKKNKSKLSFPDENLVRILSRLNQSQDDGFRLSALDLGAGSGRHSLLLQSMSYNVTAIDYSEESIAIINETIPNIRSIHSESLPYPLTTNSFDIIVAWGVLHYNPEEEMEEILMEVNRLLKPGGYFLGTLRSEFDTSLSQGNDTIINLTDLKGGYIRKFSYSEVVTLLSRFSEILIGHTQRTPLGNLNEIISHYYFQVRKPQII